MAAEIHAVVVTVSDRCARGERADESGPLLISLLEELGARVLAAEILPDDPGPLTERLRAHCDLPEVNLVLTTGGTGLAPRDQTPESSKISFTPWFSIRFWYSSSDRSTDIIENVRSGPL